MIIKQLFSHLTWLSRRLDLNFSRLNLPPTIKICFFHREFGQNITNVFKLSK